MKNHYVETSNHERFMSAIRAAEARGAKERSIVLVTGVPGAGKTCTMNYWGSEKTAITIKGSPDINMTYIHHALAADTNIKYKQNDKFAFNKALIAHLTSLSRPIIFDEAQFGLANEAKCIEYLRVIAEQAKILLVLVCHTSERHNFVGSTKAHIADRVHTEVELKEASQEDCAAYLAALCEVQVDVGIIKQVHEQSRGRYRLMSDAGVTLEAIARKNGSDSLTVSDTKGFRLCEDAQTRLRRSAK